MWTPKEWGWRFSGLDIRMPNGQIVEYYMPLAELDVQETKGLNHQLFEKWRHTSEEDRLARYDEYMNDINESYDRYQGGWEKFLHRTGMDIPAAIASFKSAVASASSMTRSKLSFRSSAEGAPTVQSPSRSLINEPPLGGLPQQTQTRPVEGSRVTIEASMSTSPSAFNIPIGGGNYKENKLKAAEEAPAYGVSEYKADLRDVLKKYEDGDENGNYLTEQDVFEEVRRIAEDGSSSPELSDAIEKYMDEVRDDRELGGRGDMDAANDAFMKAVRNEIKEKPVVKEEPAAYGLRGPNDVYGDETPELKDANNKPITPEAKPVSTVTGGILSRAKSIFHEITKLPEYTPYRRVLLTWDGNMQRWSQAATAAAQYVKKELGKSPLKAEALTIWREAAGDEAVIRKQLAATKDEKLRKGYEAALRLTPKDKEVAAWVGEQYRTLLNEAQDRGLVDYGLQNYVTHLVDMEGNKPQGFTGRLVSGFKFGQERTIPTLFDAEQLGYKPQTKDIGDLLAIYINELGKAIETKDFIKGLTETKGPDGRPLAVPMGAGETTTGDVPGKKKSYYLVRPRSKGQKYDDYKPVDHPAMTDWKWLASTEMGERMLYQGTLAIHPKVFGHLKNVLGTDAIREWYRRDDLQPMMATLRDIAKSVDWMQATTKQAMFSFSTFHWVQEGTHAIGHWVNPFGIEKIDLQGNPDHYDATIHGLRLVADFRGMASFREGLTSGPIMYKIPGAGPFLEAISEPLFTWYIPGLKYKTYKHILARNTARYKKEIAAGTATLDDVKYLSARQANAAYGHLNYVDMGRSKTIQHILQLTILAPDFLEARARFAAQGMKSIVSPTSKAGREQLRALATLAVFFFVSARILNKLFDDDYHWEEPFMLVAGNRRWGFRSVPEDMYRLFKNTVQFASGRVSPILGKTALWMITQRDFRGQPQSVLQFLKEEALTPIPISVSRMLKQGNKDIDAWQSFLTSLGLQVARYSKAIEVYDLVDTWNKQHGIVPNEGNYPISKYRDLRNMLQDERMSMAEREWQHIIGEEMKRNPELKRQEIVKKLAHGFRIGLQRPFTGSIHKEKDFVKSLNPEEKDAYDRAIQERKYIYQRFNKVYRGGTGAAAEEAPAPEPPPEE